MELADIKTQLNSENPQDRLRALTALREWDIEIAVPLLQSKLYDPAFLVRSFVMMGLGNKQNETAYDCLLDAIAHDKDHNVRAEAANSLAKYGEKSLPHLKQMFERDTHWLVRRSILAILAEISDLEAVYEICMMGLEDRDITVQESAMSCLGLLAGSHREEEALEKLLTFMDADLWRTRYYLARTLNAFNRPQAEAARDRLRQDKDPRVVGAVLEKLVQ
ncbi:MAG: HEAT repeat domain-containing protein [Cyanobacteria bacterium SBLK]|nr:HEAT repeat domain-containing protein [Cyanobacteria bacterium SBLK]